MPAAPRTTDQRVLSDLFTNLILDWRAAGFNRPQGRRYRLPSTGKSPENSRPHVPWPTDENETGSQLVAVNLAPEVGSLIGTTLGPDRIDRELGSGGMGKVYAAEVQGRCPGLDQGTPVALKLVHPHLLETEGCFNRFLREAEIGRAIVNERPGQARRSGRHQQSQHGEGEHEAVGDAVHAASPF
jgi:hypothetical protein